MAYDFTSHRLYVDAPLGAGAEVAPTPAQANYLVNVLRLRPGARVLLFNGRDGEWRARLDAAGRRSVALVAEEKLRDQSPPSDLWYLFAPLKHARLDYMVQKAVEMGAGRLVPVLTRRTQVARINRERMAANALEAAEQCGILTLPEIAEPAALEAVLRAWPDGRRLVFCDEQAGPGGALGTLSAVPPGPLAVLIGPEGGFDEAERAALSELPGVVRLSLGPRILRADTAAVAALALVQGALGDWR